MTVWEKLKNKLKADGQGPSSADWEAMQAKIAAQPQLAPASKRPIWIGWVVGLGLGLVIGSGLWFILDEKPISVKQKKEISTPLKSNVPDNTTKASSKIEESTTDMSNAEQSTLSQTKVTETPAEAEVENVSRSDNSALAGSQEAANKPAMEPERIVELSNESSSEAEVATEISTIEESGRSAAADISTPRADENTELARQETRAEQLDPPALEGDPREASKEGPAEPAESNSAEEPVLNSDTPGTADTKVPSEEEESENQPPFAEDAAGAQPLPAEEEFLDPNTGFRLQRLSFNINYLDNFNDPAALAWGGGLDLQWQKGKQFFSLGLSYQRLDLNQERWVNQTSTVIDSTYEQEFQSREEIEIRRVWVIDSMFAGRYVNDTIRRTVIDTLNIIKVDTNQSSTNIVRQTTRRIYYAELPLLYGYRWRSKKLSFALAGGLALQQAVSYQSDENEGRSQFGLSALLSPEVAWQLNTRWSLLMRSQLRYPMQGATLFYEERQLRYSFQLGVSYRW